MQSNEKSNDKPRKSFNYNFISVILLYVWALVFIFEARKIKDFDSKFFPYIVAAIAIILSTILLLSSLFGPRKYEKFDFSGTLKSVKFGIVLLVYVTFIYFLGFYISTPLYLFVAMYILGQRKIKTMISVSIVVPIVIYLFFEVLLKLTIPSGILF